MAEDSEKVRKGFYIEKELLKQCDSLLEKANARSRNEFLNQALKFYIGFLTSEKIEDYLLQSFSSVLLSAIWDSENRIARTEFKMAVELSKLTKLIAYSYELDEEDLDKLQATCVEEVKRIHGGNK